MRILASKIRAIPVPASLVIEVMGRPQQPCCQRQKETIRTATRTSTFSHDLQNGKNWTHRMASLGIYRQASRETARTRASGIGASKGGITGSAKHVRTTSNLGRSPN